MKKSKIAFIVVSILFIVLLIFIAIDFSRRTTFPGGHQENIENTPEDFQMNG